MSENEHAPRRAAGESGLPASLTRKIAATRRRLFLERALRAFWPLWCLAALTGALLFLDVFAAAPPAGALALGGALALAALVFGGLGWRAWRAPDRADALRALDLSVAHRAASMLDDDMAAGQGEAAARMWRAHRARLAEEARRARPPAADLRLSERDPWGLRYVALLALVVAGAYSRVGGADRVAALLDPAPAPLAAAALEPALEAWASPPPYTGMAPVYLTERRGESVELPVGTRITLRASGVAAAPGIHGLDGAFASEAAGVYGAETTLSADAELSIEAEGESLGSWTLVAIADSPPQIGVTAAPEPTGARWLGFAFAAEDDYGVVEARGVIVADRSGMENPPAEEPDAPIELPLTPPESFADEIVEQEVERDLTEHPLAGSPVRMALHATDAAGQSGESAPESFVLPARIFTEPMAKALIEQRRKLAWDLRDAWDVHDMLEAVTAYPDDYFKDASAYLLISSAIRRMRYALDEDRMAGERDGVLDLLWRAALALEEGDLSNALERLRTARRKLQDAIERGASEEEIERLTEEMRQAMNAYLDEMVRQAMRDAQNGENGEQAQQRPPESGQSMNREDLERMLEQLEQAAREGDREAAEQMLAMLGQMLENMRMQRADSFGDGQGDRDMQALQDMMREQQELADETFRQLQDGAQNPQQNRPGQGGSPGQRPQPGQQPGTGRQGMQGEGRSPGQGQGEGQGRGQGESPRPGGEGGALAGRQEGLRGDLEGVLDRAGRDGEAGERLGEAEREMGDARDSLREGDLDSALDEQARALDRLREGAQAMAREAEREGRGRDGRGRGAEAGRPGERLDPLGRLSRTYGPDDGLGVEVPGERSRNRALEIQREIRRRQSERERPRSEREYLDRLQRPF